MRNKPAALVLGLCVHGLAVSRALSRSGIIVYAIESNTKLPGVKTKFAKVIFVDDINGPKLTANLIKTFSIINPPEKIILFPINDNMVREIANHWQELSAYFELSWAHCWEQILKLQLKSEIEGICQQQKLRYPRSILIHKLEDLDNNSDKIPFPLIIKPVKPLSSFKTLKVYTAKELRSNIVQYQSDLPILCQQWIDGSDEQLIFCALYLNKGRVQSHFVGHKLESFPPAMGQTTVAENYEDQKALVLTKQFFAGLNLSGPVSLEFKIDRDGEYWVIEPTVGRTDFWIDCVIQSGINLPLIEYSDILGCDQYPNSVIANRIWFDSEKDVFSYIKMVIRYKSFYPKRKKPIFPYFGYNDYGPSIYSYAYTSKRLALSLSNRILRLFKLPK